jgi:hypothetical protein
MIIKHIYKLRDYQCTHEKIQHTLGKLLGTKLPPLTEVVSTLSDGTHHFCEKREYAFNVLPEYAFNVLPEYLIITTLLDHKNLYEQRSRGVTLFLRVN